MAMRHREASDRRVKLRNRLVLFSVVITDLWVIACALVQDRPGSALVAAGAGIGILLIFAALPIFADAPALTLASILVVVFIGYELWTGASWGRDIFIIVLSVGAATFVAAGILAADWIDSFPTLRTLIAAALLSWSGISLLDHYRGVTATEVAVAIPIEGDDWTRPTRVAVSLSGGGYRAAVLHAGVLKALDRLGVPIGNLATVSGGSIVGAFYAIGGTPDQFVSHVRGGRLGIRRELLHVENVIRLPFPAELPFLNVQLLPFFEFSRSDIQADLLDRVLFERRLLRDLNKGQGPKLMVCATDLSRGALVGIVADALIIEHVDAGVGEKRIRHELWPVSGPDVWPSSGRISQVVAASGAFPLAFSPQRVEVTTSTADGDRRRELVLADAGLTDNSGVRLLIAAADTSDADRRLVGWDISLIIASEGGAIFGPIAEVTLANVLGRSADIVYATASLKQNPTAVPMVRLDPRPYAAYFAAMDSDSTDLKEYWATRAAPSADLLAIIRMQSSVSEYLLSLARSGSPRSVLLERAEEFRAFHRAVQSNSPIRAMELLESIVDKVVEEDFRRCIEAYVSTNTLDDQLSPATVDSLYRLGQYLVILKWGEIATQLRRPA